MFLIISSLVNVSSAMSQLQSDVETIGKKATVFSLKDTNGNKVDTAEIIGKKPVIFFFWTTWCPHCREQLSRLKKDAQDIKDVGAELILVDIQESKSQVNRFLENTNSSLTSLLDEDAKAAELYRVIGVPTFVIVGQDEIIKYHDNILPAGYKNILSAIRSNGK